MSRPGMSAPTLPTEHDAKGHEHYVAVALRASARRWRRGLPGLLEVVPAKKKERNVIVRSN